MNIVSLKYNRTEEKIENGRELPYLVQSEKPPSTLFIVDSKDRVSGSTSDFMIDFYRGLSRPRYLKIVRATIPKINNVNPNNNTLQITHFQGTTATFTLDVGIYNPTTLANELTSKINAAFAAVPISDNVTTSFDPATRTFSITSVAGEDFYIHSDCSFITRGGFLAPFSSLPSGSTPVDSTIYSGISPMLYTRYLSIQSEALTRHIYGSALSSKIQLSVNLVATIDMTSLYTPEDFDVSIPFTSVYESFPVDQMNISVLNTERLIPRFVDIRVVDEYGLLLETSLNLGSPYPTNTLGVSLVGEISF